MGNLSDNLTPQRRAMLEDLADNGRREFSELDPRVAQALVQNRWADFFYLTPAEARGQYVITEEEKRDMEADDKVLLIDPLQLVVTDDGRRKIGREAVRG